MYSESESYFGMRPIYDGNDILFSAIDLLVSVICTFCPWESIDNIVYGTGEFVKIAILLANKKYEEITELIANNFKNDITGLITFDDMEVLSDIVNIAESYNDFIESLEGKPQYFAEIIDYYLNEVNYVIYVQFKNDIEMHMLSDINNYV